MEFYVTFGGWAVGKLYTHTLPDADKNYKSHYWLYIFSSAFLILHSFHCEVGQVEESGEEVDYERE